MLRRVGGRGFSSRILLTFSFIPRCSGDHSPRPDGRPYTPVLTYGCNNGEIAQNLQENAQVVGMFASASQAITFFVSDMCPLGLDE